MKNFHRAFFSATTFVLFSAILSAAPAAAKQSIAINQPEGQQIYVSVGDLLVKANLRESLPNAFGGADLFGRKRDRGFVEIRYIGMTNDGKAIFRRRSVDIYSNETTMTRMQPRWGSATVTASGDTAHVSTFSTGSDRATVEALPPDTVEFSLDLAKNKIITLEDRQIEILSADTGGVNFIIRRR